MHSNWLHCSDSSNSNNSSYPSYPSYLSYPTSLLTLFARDKRQVLAHGHVGVDDVGAETRVELLRPEVVLDLVEAENFLGLVGKAACGLLH